VGAKWLTTVQRELVNVVEDAGITLDDTIDDQLLQAIKLIGGSGSIGNRNLCGNPHFELWTRWGTVLKAYVAPGDHVLDRWWYRPDDAGGNGEGDAVQGDLGAGVAGFDDGHPRFYLDIDQTTNPTIAAGFRVGQYIYDFNQFDDETVTWSIWARSEDGSPLDFTMIIRMHYGTGGAPSADEVVVTQAKNVNAFARVSVSGTFLNFQTKTFGTNDDARIELEIIAGSSSEAGIHLTQSQLELGNSATTFTKPLPSSIIAEAARHWQTSFRPGDRGEINAFDGEYSTNKETSNTQLVEVDVRLIPEMRRIPDVTWYNPGTGDLDRISVGGTERTVSASTVVSEKSLGKPTITVADNGTIVGHYIAEAETVIA